MEKKSVSITFRTTETNDEYLKMLASKKNISIAVVLNSMIDAFKERGIDHPFDIR